MPRDSKSAIVSRAAAILDDSVYQQAWDRQHEEVLKAMEQLDLEGLTHEEAAGRALVLVMKYQATRTQKRSLEALLQYQRLEERRTSKQNPRD